MSYQTLAVPENADRPPLECRVYERQSCDIPATCHPASLMDMKEAGWKGTVCDISQGGARLHLPRRFERGTGLAIELPGDADGEPVVVFVKVVHLKADARGGWALGCKFVSDLSDDEVQRLIHAVQAQEPSHEEDDVLAGIRAATPSVLANVCVELEKDGRLAALCTIRRLDVSKSWPLGPGKCIRIQGRGRDDAPRTFEIEISHLVQEDARWRLRGRLVSDA